MSDRLELYEITVPAGTTKTAPLVTNLPFAPGYLRRWQVIVPDGVAGLAGFAFAYAGQQLVPNTPGAFLTGNGEVLADELGYHFTGSQWRFIAYNLGLFPHTFRVRLYVDELAGDDTTVSTVPTVLPVTINAGTVDLSPPELAPLDLGGDVALTLPADVTPLDLESDTVPVDTGDTVTPLDLPADAPAVVDSTDTTASPEVSDV